MMLSVPPWRHSPSVRFDRVTRRFGEFAAVDSLTLDIFEGEFFALLGPSGCGKTTLLRLLAGFEAPDAGEVILDGKNLTDVPPYRRPVNMMFQSYALFPHLTVAGNVAFGLKQDRLPKNEIVAQVDEMLGLVKMRAYAERRPDQLSGGQRQRVALARSLVKQPKVLLLDEPLAALDRKLREETRSELKELQRRLGTTFVIVTHDQDEAMALADRIGVMNEGRLAQVGTPVEIYEQPRSRWVAGFVGDVNVVEGHITAVYPTFVTFEREGLRLRLPQMDVSPGPAAVALRPEKIRIARAVPEEGLENTVSGVIADIGYLGTVSLYKVRLDGGLILKAAVMNKQHGSAGTIGQNDRVWLSWAPEAGILLTE